MPVKKKQKIWQSILPAGAIMMVWIIWFRRQYMLAGVLLILCAMLPYLISFERSKPKARDIVLTAVLTALAVAGRAAFFMLPQIKPTCAIVIVTGICFGSARGFLVGALSALLSNFLFSQGLWTPFQMLALGMSGWLSGAVFFEKQVPSRWKLCAFGLVISAVVYGLLVEGSSFFFLQAGEGIEAVLTVYLTGVFANLLHGIATTVFLRMFGLPLIRKLQRIRQKYDLKA